MLGSSSLWPQPLPIRLFLWLIAFAIPNLLIGTASAQSTPAPVELAWDPNPETDLAGYRLYYGTRSGDHPTRVEVGNVTTAQLSQPVPTTLYVVCVAYNTAGLESLPSNEIAVTFTAPDTIPPNLTGVPADLVVLPTDPLSLTARVQWTPPVAADDSGSATLLSTHQPGDQFPPGTSTVSFQAQDAAGNRTTASFTVTVAGYQVWEQDPSGGGSAGVQPSPDANSDGDQWSNLSEYALGLNAAAIDGSQIIQQRIGDDTVVLQFSHNRYIPDVLLRVETTENLLQPWQPLVVREPTGTWSYRKTGVTLTSQQLDGQDSITIEEAIGTRTSAFYRVMVEKIANP